MVQRRENARESRVRREQRPLLGQRSLRQEDPGVESDDPPDRRKREPQRQRERVARAQEVDERVQRAGEAAEKLGQGERADGGQRARFRRPPSRRAMPAQLADCLPQRHRDAGGDEQGPARDPRAIPDWCLGERAADEQERERGNGHGDGAFRHPTSCMLWPVLRHQSASLELDEHLVGPDEAELLASFLLQNARVDG